VADNDAFLYEKQLIFYVLAGVKPASEVGSFHMEELSPAYAEARPDDQRDVAAFLESLGLHYAFKSSYDGMVTVSLSEGSIRARCNINIPTNEASIYEASGRLYGYPETVIAACVANWVYDQSTLMSIEDHEYRRLGADRTSSWPTPRYCYIPVSLRRTGKPSLRSCFAGTQC
jgi:hypothetical protein